MNKIDLKAVEDAVLAKGLPANEDAERYSLGSILLGGIELFDKVDLKPEDFSLEKNRRIYARMLDLRDRGVAVDRITLAEELMRQGQLESVDGLSYLISLDDGLPEIANLGAYVEIVREKSRLRQIIHTSQSAINQALLAEAKAEDIAASTGKTLDAISTGPGDDSGKTAQQVVEEYRGGISAFLDPSQRKSGLPTGLNKVDEMLGGGLQQGELVIIAARPSCGKSAIALNIAQNLCLREYDPLRVDFFSLEMSGSSLITRMMCARAQMDQHKFRGGYVGKDDRLRLQKSLNDVMESRLRIHDDSVKTLGGLMKSMKRAVKEGSSLLILDYLQLVTTGRRTDNRNQELSEICRTLKLFNLDSGVPMAALSQIGRSSERRGGNMKPQLGDLKDSGAIEETGNVVIALHREELYSKGREDNRGKAEALILKNRDGPTGTVNLRFIHAWSQFVNASENVRDEDQRPADEPEPMPMEF